MAGGVWRETGPHKDFVGERLEKDTRVTGVRVPGTGPGQERSEYGVGNQVGRTLGVEDVEGGVREM